MEKFRLRLLHGPFEGRIRFCSSRLLGSGVALLALVTWIARRRHSRFYLLLLLLSVALVSLAGHTGGTLSYGPDWLSWPPK